MPSHSSSRSSRWYCRRILPTKYQRSQVEGALSETINNHKKSFLMKHMSLLIHQTNWKPFALQGPTSSHTPHLHPLMRRMSQGKEFQKRSAQRSKVRLSPFHPIPNMKVLRVLRLSSFLAIQTGMYDTPWAGVQVADRDNPNPIQSHCFRSASSVVVVEGDLHYIHLLISSSFILQEWYQWYKGLSVYFTLFPQGQLLSYSLGFLSLHLTIL